MSGRLRRFALAGANRTCELLTGTALRAHTDSAARGTCLFTFFQMCQINRGESIRHETLGSLRVRKGLHEEARMDYGDEFLCCVMLNDHAMCRRFLITHQTGVI